MIKFILKRLFYGFLVLLGVITVVFLLFNVLPGDPARMMLGQRADKASIDIKICDNELQIIEDGKSIVKLKSDLNEL